MLRKRRKIRSSSEAMFTGIIESLAEVQAIARRAAAARLLVASRSWGGDVQLGESIAINGACLTADEIQTDAAAFDVVTETLDRTTLGDLRVGDRVNVERSLRLSDRLGGHLVSGHVDGVGVVRERVPEPGQTTFVVEAPPELTDQMIPKGSVAVDGISLTIVTVERARFSVAIIPHTLDRTTLGFRAVGDRVNIETDMIGKWVQKLTRPADSEGGVTIEKLREQGFV